VKKGNRQLKNKLIRRATPEDYERIKAFCLADNPDDFVPGIWPIWMSGKNTVNLVAQVDDSIVGCVYGEILSGHDAWSQGLRVYHKCRNRGLGTDLMAALENELLKMGAQVIYANIGVSNTASLSTVYKLDWQDERHVIRRRILPQTEFDGKPGQLSRDKTAILIRQHPILASIQKTAYFKRVYFSMNHHYLNQAFNRNAIRISSNERSYAILDFNTDPAEKIWVTAMAGELSGILWLIESLVGEAGRLGAELVIDSLNNPAIQSLMDKLEFEPAGKEGSYVVVKKILIQ